MRRHPGRQAVRGARALSVGLCVLLLADLASAQPVDVPPTWGGGFWDRPRLTGSWFGLRDELGKKGVVLDLDLTQVPQGVITGGRDDVAKYGGLAEYTLNVDTQKLGLWPSGFLNVMAMTGYGQSVNSASSALVPPNFIALLPRSGDENVTGLMSLTYMQFLSKQFGLLAGKLYTLSSGDVNALAHDFHSQFLNTGLSFNMVLDLFPYTGYGGGIVLLPWKGTEFTVSVVDPDGTATNNDISEAFQSGVLVAAQGRVTIKPFGLVGHQVAGFGWSNKQRLSLEQDPSNIGRLLLAEQFPRLSDPGPILRRILERFFPELLVPAQPLNKVNYT